jgi:hypothetical protein
MRISKSKVVLLAVMIAAFTGFTPAFSSDVPSGKCAQGSPRITVGKTIYSCTQVGALHIWIGKTKPAPAKKQVTSKPKPHIYPICKVVGEVPVVFRRLVSRIATGDSPSYDEMYEAEIQEFATHSERYSGSDAVAFTEMTNSFIGLGTQMLKGENIGHYETKQLVSEFNSGFSRFKRYCP